MRMNKLLYGIGSLMLSTSIASAGSMGGLTTPPAFFRDHVNFTIGAYQSSQGQAQHIAINTLIGNDLTLTKKNDEGFLLGMGYYLNDKERGLFKWSYGINAFYLSKTQVKGTVIQERLFENLSYRYQVSHLPAYAALRAAISNQSQKYVVIFDGGVGPNFMTTSSYAEQSLDGGITQPDNAFLGRSKTVFSATAGIGVQWNRLLGDASLAVGYRFFYLGEGDFTPRTNQILNTLKTGTNYANALVLTLSV
jgi:hypothetical protein